MASKVDISRLLKKGLTGWEAGILAFESFWLETRGQEAILSNKDLSLLKSGIKTERDANIWNLVMQLYRTCEYMEQEAKTSLLEASVALERAAGLGHIRLAPLAAEMMLAREPQIMTQKQWEEERQAIIARQRQSKLQELEPLWEIIFLRASILAPDTWHEEWSQLGEALEDGDAPDEATFLKGQYPEAWRQGRLEILGLIQAGRLKPVQLSQEDVEKLDGLTEQILTYRERRSPPGETREEIIQRSLEGRYPPGWTRADDIRWMALATEKEALRQEAYQRARQDSQGMAGIAASLEQWDSLQEEEATRLLEYTFCLGEELYQAGLPEWKHEIDTYYEMLYEPDLAEDRVAIIPKPKERQLDRRGYYKKPQFSWPLAPLLEEEEFSELFMGVTGLATKEIGRLLARRQVLEEVSYYIGLALYEALDVAIQTILRPAIGRYNMLAKAVSNARVDPKLFEQYGHTLIRWSRLKPPRKELARLRKWISESVGEGWWEGVQDKHSKPKSLIPIPEKVRKSLQGLQQEEDEDES